MSLPLLTTAFVMMAPLDQGADQATLAQLFRTGVETRFEQRPAEHAGAVHTWIGAGCVSIIAVRESSGARSAYSIQWSGASIAPASGERVVAVKGFRRAQEPVPEQATLFRFKDAETASTARAAMERLQAACTPQR